MKFFLSLVQSILELILQKKEPKSDSAKSNTSNISTTISKEPKKALSLNDWITSSGKYPERAKEMTDEIKVNAITLVEKVNQLLEKLGISEVDVSSGFRPESVNSKIANAAKKSAHMSGKAIDLSDKDGKIKALVGSQPELLRELELFMEDSKSTPTWCHVDYVDRKDRPSRTFIP